MIHMSHKIEGIFFRKFQNDFPDNFAQQHGVINTSIDSSRPRLGTSEFKNLKKYPKNSF